MSAYFVVCGKSGLMKMSSSKDRSTPLTNRTLVKLRHFRLSKATVGVKMFDHLLDEVRPEEAAKCRRVGTEWHSVNCRLSGMCPPHCTKIVENFVHSLIGVCSL